MGSSAGNRRSSSHSSPLWCLRLRSGSWRWRVWESRVSLWHMQRTRRRTQSAKRGLASRAMCFSIERGQATVEAALLLPVLALLVLMIAQPAIILYDRMVMSCAAAEGCRLLSTLPADDAPRVLDAYVRRRLGAIPPVDVFHVHNPCSWEVEAIGSEGSAQVAVTVRNALRPLPLMKPAAALLGEIDGQGNFSIEVTVRMDARPSWASGSPNSWIGAWE